MTHVLTFKAEDMLRVVTHALNAPAWRPCYDIEATGPTIWMVADEGIYFMSAGVPGDALSPALTNFFVAYADTFDPRVNDGGDMYDRRSEMFGDGSDFAESFDKNFCEMVLAKITAGAMTIQLEITDTSYTLLASDLTPKEQTNA